MHVFAVTHERIARYPYEISEQLRVLWWAAESLPIPLGLSASSRAPVRLSMAVLHPEVAPRFVAHTSGLPAGAMFIPRGSDSPDCCKKASRVSLHGMLVRSTLESTGAEGALLGCELVQRMQKASPPEACITTVRSSPGSLDSLCPAQYGTRPRDGDCISVR